MLEWIIGRVQGIAAAVETPVGMMPHYNDINWNGLENFTEAKFNELTSLDAEKWKNEVTGSAEFFAKYEGPMPAAFDKIQKEILGGFAKKTGPRAPFNQAQI